MYLNKNYLIILISLLILAGLGVFGYVNKDKVFYQQVSHDQISNWKNQDFIKLKSIFVKNCKQGSLYYKKRELDDRFGSKKQWADFCSGLVKLNDDKTSIREYFEKLEVLKVHQPFKKTSLFTGYYSPVLQASLVKTDEFNYPLYKRPKDLIELNVKDFIDDENYKYKKIFGKLSGSWVKPYYTRKQIEEDNVLSKEDVLVWVKDKVGAFFLHVQGSGQVQLADGTFMNVGYAGQNGHKYFAIGRYMASQGMLELDNISLQTIRVYLNDNPHNVDDILQQNPSFIFFAESTKKATGAFGNVLTANYSVATDRSFVPLGIPLFIDTTVNATGKKFQHMVFSQDIGGAIKGAIRADIFFGSDDQAEEKSGKQNHEGLMYVFSAKNI